MFVSILVSVGIFGKKKKKPPKIKSDDIRSIGL
jgi:hypothetical protein